MEQTQTILVESIPHELEDEFLVSIECKNCGDKDSFWNPSVCYGYDSEDKTWIVGTQHTRALNDFCHKCEENEWLITSIEYLDKKVIEG